MVLLEDSGSAAFMITANVTATSSIPEETSSVEVTMTPVRDQVFRGPDPSRLAFHMTPSQYQDTVSDTVVSDTGFHVELADAAAGSMVQSESYPYENGVSLQVTFVEQSSTLQTLVQVRQSWWNALSAHAGLLSALFTVFAASVGVAEVLIATEGFKNSRLCIYCRHCAKNRGSEAAESEDEDENDFTVEHEDTKRQKMAAKAYAMGLPVMRAKLAELERQVANLHQVDQERRLREGAAAEDGAVAQNGGSRRPDTRDSGGAGDGTVRGPAPVVDLSQAPKLSAAQVRSAAPPPPPRHAVAQPPVPAASPAPPRREPAASPSPALSLPSERGRKRDGSPSAGSGPSSRGMVRGDSEFDWYDDDESGPEVPVQPARLGGYY